MIRSTYDAASVFFVKLLGEAKPERLEESLFSRNNIKLIPDAVIVV